MSPRPTISGTPTAGGTKGHETLLAQLVDIGLARNEALAYLTLLEEDGSAGLTGYEVAARSGIPRSAVYAVLRKLEAGGAAFGEGSDPVRYLPRDPGDWVNQVRRDTMGRLGALQAGLGSLPKRARPEPVWILRRYDEVLARLDVMIRGAESSIYASLWPRELAVLTPALDAVAHRPLHRVLHCPERLDHRPAGFSCWVDDLSGDPAKAGWSHKALVVVDRREAIIGGTEPHADNHTVWTANSSLVDVATNHIVLDVTLLARKQGVDCGEVVAPMMRPHLDD